MRTDMLEKVMEEKPWYEQMFAQSNLMNRIAYPDELNAAMLYLVSDASSFTTAEDLLIDGGMTEKN